MIEATIKFTLNFKQIERVAAIIDDLINNPSTSARKRAREFLDELQAEIKAVNEGISEGMK